MIMSPRAGGVGLTLTHAPITSSIYPGGLKNEKDQCNGRALRIGQTRPVNVYIPLATLPRGGH